MLDATGQALAYIYAREKQSDADIAHALTFDEARRIAVNVAKLRGMEINKQTAARRLIHAAIRLACQREDPLAIHILIMSAHDVIRDCAEARGKHLENSIQPKIPADQRKEVRDSLKEMHHFLRHAKEDADKTLDDSEVDSFNDALIAVTCQMHKELFHETLAP